MARREYDAVEVKVNPKSYFCFSKEAVGGIGSVSGEKGLFFFLSGEDG
jgi:hypothetical protein